MAEFYKASRLWVIDYRYDGKPRRWFKAAPAGVDLAAQAPGLLQELHGQRAQLVAARPATADEELDYVRGAPTGNVYCPTGRGRAG